MIDKKVLCEKKKVMGCRKHSIPTTTGLLSGTAMILLVDMIDTLYANHEALGKSVYSGGFEIETH